MWIIYKTAVLLFLLIELFGLVQARLGMGARHWFWAGLVVGATLIVSHKTVYRKQIVFLYLTTLIIFIYSVSGYDTYPWTLVLSQFSVQLAGLLIIYVQIDNPYKSGYFTRWIVFSSLLFILITAIITIIRGGAELDIVRDAVVYASSENSMDTMEMMHIRRTGVVSYGLLHSMPTLIPVIIGQIKNNRSVNIRCILLLSLLLICGMVIRASFGTPLIMGTIFILISTFMTRRLATNIIVIFVSMVVAILITRNAVLDSILINVQPYFDGTAIYSKIDDIIYSLQVNAAAGQLAGRQMLYDQSWKAFLANPLMGNPNHSLLGGHAYFRDFLGYYGLLGFLPLLAFMFMATRDVFRKIRPAMRSYYLLSILAYIGMGCYKNYAGFEPFLVFFMLVPLICLMDQLSSSAGKNSLFGGRASGVLNRI